ncbi:pre-mRNA-processing ATP-dependent RNA helicase prp5-like isoform X2 [Zootermopsis nevadensis]|uniref:pre-mRNA-processing ATP-dependent RNA helicase prp5-like isoform X2 n=1 Tax=Zootermopsis nevadensis TaxID=136037 RepID=UPI000B8E4AB6|nr:pre-mRNA-processing ATP-dependent RNA helicase prp5-like isoform X2 [Zootermopsis nevadensis]
MLWDDYVMTGDVRHSTLKGCLYPDAKLGRSPSGSPYNLPVFLQVLLFLFVESHVLSRHARQIQSIRRNIPINTGRNKIRSGEKRNSTTGSSQSKRYDSSNAQRRRKTSDPASRSSYDSSNAQRRRKTSDPASRSSYDSSNAQRRRKTSDPASRSSYDSSNAQRRRKTSDPASRSSYDSSNAQRRRKTSDPASRSSYDSSNAQRRRKTSDPASRSSYDSSNAQRRRKTSDPASRSSYDSSNAQRRRKTSDPASRSSYDSSNAQRRRKTSDPASRSSYDSSNAQRRRKTSDPASRSSYDSSNAQRRRKTSDPASRSSYDSSNAQRRRKTSDPASRSSYDSSNAQRRRKTSDPASRSSYDSSNAQRRRKTSDPASRSSYESPYIQWRRKATDPAPIQSYRSPYAQRSRKTGNSTATAPSSNTTSEPFLDEKELKHLEVLYMAKKRTFYSMKIELVRKQNKLIKFYFSLAKLHQRILKTTGNDIGLVQKIKIIKFCTVCTAQPEDLERCDKTTDERSKRVRFSLDAITGDNLPGLEDTDLTEQPQSDADEVESTQDKGRNMEESSEDIQLRNAEQKLIESQQNLYRGEYEVEQDSSNYKEKELIKNGAAEEEWKEINKEEDHPDLSELQNALNEKREREYTDNFLNDKNYLLKKSEVTKLEKQEENLTEEDETKYSSPTAEGRKRRWTNLFKIKSWKIWKRKEKNSKHPSTDTEMTATKSEELRLFMKAEKDYSKND